MRLYQKISGNPLNPLVNRHFPINIAVKWIIFNNMFSHLLKHHSVETIVHQLFHNHTYIYTYNIPKKRPPFSTHQHFYPTQERWCTGSAWSWQWSQVSSDHPQIITGGSEEAIGGPDKICCYYCNDTTHHQCNIKYKVILIVIVKNWYIYMV